MAKQIRNKDIDFLSAYYASEKNESSIKKNAKYILPPICLLLAFGGGFGVLKYKQMDMNNKIEDVQTQLDKIKVEKENKKIDEKKKSFDSIQSLLNALKSNVDNLNTYPQLSKSSISTILKLGTGLTIGDILYDQTTASLSLSVEAPKVAQINTFVAQIRNAGLFGDVLYTGYEENKKTDTDVNGNPGSGTVSSTTTVTTSYSAKVTCVIKEGA